MIKKGSCEYYDFVLNVKTPVSISSGKKIPKNEYIIEGNNVRIINMNSLVKLVGEKGLTDEFERLILLQTYKGGLGEFLKEYFTKEETEDLVLYSCDSRNVFDEKKNPMEIIQFMRDSFNRPYIPGSSLKGAFRTCLLANILSDNPEKSSESWNLKCLESNCFNTLDVHKKKENAVNSIMRTISVSDSQPIDFSHITICRKKDVTTGGNISCPNTARECLKPSTQVHFTVSFDGSFKGGVTLNMLMNAIDHFSKYYSEKYTQHFRLPHGVTPYNYDGCLILGGGSGFFSKTVVYPAIGYKKALEKTAFHFSKNKISKNHKHEADIEKGISPHTLKYTELNNNLVPMGICQISVK